MAYRGLKMTLRSARPCRGCGTMVSVVRGNPDGVGRVRFRVFKRNGTFQCKSKTTIPAFISSLALLSSRWPSLHGILAPVARHLPRPPRPRPLRVIRPLLWWKPPHLRKRPLRARMHLLLWKQPRLRPATNQGLAAVSVAADPICKTGKQAVARRLACFFMPVVMVSEPVRPVLRAARVLS